MPDSPVQQILGPPPAGSPWQTKVLWYTADAVATGLIYQLFDYGVPINPAPTSETDPPAQEWMHVQVRYADLNSQDAADDQVYTFDILKIDSLFSGDDWDSAAFTTCDALLNALVASLAPGIVSRLQAVDLRYYRRAFLPRENPKPFTDAGGPSHVYALNRPSTGTGAMVPQACSTVTEKTPSRKHWGRFYLPTIAGSAVDANGRLVAGYRDPIIAALETLMDGFQANGFRMVVPTTSSGGVFDPTVEGDWTTVVARTLQGVTAFRIDDVADVHRSRRHKFKLVFSETAAT